MSRVIKYIQVDCESSRIIFEFLLMSGKTAAGISNDIIQQLENDELDNAVYKAQG